MAPCSRRSRSGATRPSSTRARPRPSNTSFRCGWCGRDRGELMQFTLIDLWAHMGVAARLIAGTMLLMSLVSLLIACERLLTLLAAKRESLAYAHKLAELLRNS